jgi:nanoRNase/pAp phosphatase (c-di-AMP/oligoRNAs hydrolase)
VLVALSTGLSLPETNQPEQLIGQYQDAAAVPDWAREQVASAIAAGIISPSATTNDLLRPNAPATRAEVAALIYSALAYMGKVQPLE